MSGAEGPSRPEGPDAGREEVRDLLVARRAELTSEVSELAQPVRAPGVQMQFGKRAGDHTSDAVMQMTRTVAAGELSHLAAEIDRALEKLDEGSYGVCDACGRPISPERLEALPWAVLCVSCKAGGDGRR
jgi:DnaK suppressor protein